MVLIDLDLSEIEHIDGALWAMARNECCPKCDEIRLRINKFKDKEVELANERNLEQTY